MAVDSISALTQSLVNIDNQILSLSANPKPTYSINGQNIQWGEYYKQLLEMRQGIANALVLAQGPSMTVIEGAT